MMKNFNWSKYSKPIILVAFIVVLSILRPKAFLSLDNFSNVLWSVAVIGIMVSGTIFVFLIGGIDLSIATLCAFSAVIAVTVTHNMGDTPGAVFAGVVCGSDRRCPGRCRSWYCHHDLQDPGIPGDIRDTEYFPRTCNGHDQQQDHQVHSSRFHGDRCFQDPWIPAPCILHGGHRACQLVCAQKDCIRQICLCSRRQPYSI